MKNVLLLVVMALFFVACKDEEVKTKLRYDAPIGAKLVKKDSVQLALADLPIVFEGTDYLIHPIGDLHVLERTTKASYSASNVVDFSFTVSNYSDNEITGYLQNLKFQHKNSDSLVALTNKPIVILTASYLKGISAKTSKQILAYTVIDADTNKDKKLDSNDIKCLYLSTINGSFFTKISKDTTELVDWEVLEANNRIYFRTVDDTNKNGQFDKDDVVHYQYVDLLKKKWEAEDYLPVN